MDSLLLFHSFKQNFSDLFLPLSRQGFSFAILLQVINWLKILEISMQVFVRNFREYLLWFLWHFSNSFNHFHLPLIWWNRWQSKTLVKHVSRGTSLPLDNLFFRSRPRMRELDFRQLKTSFGKFLSLRGLHLLCILLILVSLGCKRYSWLMRDHGPPLVSNGCRMLLISILLSGDKYPLRIILLFLRFYFNHRQVKRFVPRLSLSLKFFFNHVVLKNNGLCFKRSIFYLQNKIN